MASAKKPRQKIRASAHGHRNHIVQTIVEVAASRTMFADLEKSFFENSIYHGIAMNQSWRLFDWLVEMANFQGISDQVAQAYLDEHGSVDWWDVRGSLEPPPLCPKLESYWAFSDCGYRKNARRCNCQRLIHNCPLPKFDLRNGRLNQAAFALYFFMRDVTDGDLIGWLDRQTADVKRSGNTDEAINQHLIEPLCNIHGLSDKVVSLLLSYLFIGCGPVKPDWLEVGGNMIVVDSLLHNFLHRTGLLRRFHAEHNYGPGCYLPGRCRDLIREAAHHIDASTLNPAYPRVFPRLIQQALWRYCAGEQLSICNGLEIDDRKRCENVDCVLFKRCDRLALKPPKKPRKQRKVADS